jgi:hypothetical protein
MKIVETITDEKTTDKIFELISRYQDQGYEIVENSNATPLEILSGTCRDILIETIIEEAKKAVIGNKIKDLEDELSVLLNKKYRANRKKIFVGEGLNGDYYSINYINKRKKQRIIENINANIEELKDELANI